MKEMMKLGSYAIVLIALAAIVLSGIAIVQQYQTTLKTNTAGNQSLAISSGSGTLTYDELVSFGKLSNITSGDVYIDGNVSTSDTVNVSLSTGVVTTSLGDGTDYQAEYVYKADTEASNTANYFVTGLGIFGAFVGVLAISVIGKVIIGLFKKS